MSLNKTCTEDNALSYLENNFFLDISIFNCTVYQKEKNGAPLQIPIQIIIEK